MASTRDYLAFILEQLSDLDDVSYRPMMGEYILYYRDKIIGGIYDNRLLLKNTESALKILGAPHYEIPYEGAKEMLLMDDVNDEEFLVKLFQTVYEGLPTPKKKKNRSLR